MTDSGSPTSGFSARYSRNYVSAEKHDQRVSMLLSADLMGRLQEVANERGFSFSDTVRLLLDERLSEIGKVPTKKEDPSWAKDGASKGKTRNSRTAR